MHLDGASFARKTPEQCSGGMLQRAAVALALSKSNAWIVADEPTSALDPELRLRVIQLTKNYAQRHNVGVIWITHHVQETAPLADQLLECKQGRVYNIEQCMRR
jgi:peptide/nickel transport system ATP-binding protein